ncbi:FAD binding domain protein [Cordyceps fumosorosea ARSEF 2679]|uniref:FAD binding domain protein n=1 Tax=Cordyceps fumosorosea (strain ARSEF 2679) TaxID=1081104 RepID=A0A167PP57_CORFA|nr:FAD binding domain protein [Cordyceps fumosorosea ARSEF 2679]OAA56878.1 FAD binding domain protein [Cordyceps fumosorosea ARSEF 2679]
MWLPTFGLVAGLLASVALATNNTNNALHACAALSSVLPGTVAYPSSPAYAAGMSYWSALPATQRPSCLVTPSTSTDVSLVLTTLIHTNTPFTFRAGGHTAHANGSNINSYGVNVDLARLRTLRVAPDRGSVSVGAGLRWGDVSAALDPLGLAVLGGRDADVGVAGLLLGGGFSFFSGRRGWACDGVLAMEVVLASGEVVQATAGNEHRELFRALKGGGGANFGVVTRFDLAAFPQGDVWTRTVVWPGDARAAIAEKAMGLVTEGMEADPDAHAYFVRTYQPDLGGFVNLASFFHAGPVTQGEDASTTTPAVFSPFDEISGALSNVTAVANVTAVTSSISTPYGLRRAWSNLSFAAGSPALISELLALWDASVLALLPRADAAYAPFVIYQAVSRGQLRASRRRGPNAMGLAPEDGPMVVMHFLTGWGDAALDGVVMRSTRELVRAAEEAARRRGAHREFVYMNYAGEWQDVVRRYGPESYAQLLGTSLRYDPRRDLQRLWRGYFSF